MKSPHGFICKPVKGSRYKNTKEIGGINFITNVSEESAKHSNREALVVELPSHYKGPIKKGDTLIVHHNVFKYYNDMKGARRSGNSYLGDGLFLVDHFKLYGYKNAKGLHAVDKYCFVKPVKTIESWIHKPFSEEPLMGEMVALNDYLKYQGIRKGDLVSFTPDSEYEFNIDGQKLYRVFDHQITMQLDEEVRS